MWYTSAMRVIVLLILILASAFLAAVEKDPAVYEGQVLIKNKLGAATRAEAVAIALHHRLIGA